MGDSYMDNSGWDEELSSERKITPNVQGGGDYTKAQSWEDKELDDTVAKMRQLNDLISRARDAFGECEEVETIVKNRSAEVRAQVEEFRGLLSELDSVIQNIEMRQNWVKKEVSNTSFELGTASREKLQQGFAECVQQELKAALNDMKAEMNDFKEDYWRDFRNKLEEVTHQTQKKGIVISERVFWEGVVLVCVSFLFGTYGIFYSGLGKFIPIVAVLLLFGMLVVWLVKLFRGFDNR